jgi:ankyrin repeat protein
LTFDDAHKLIKKGDVLGLRRELDSGMSPDLSNQFSWTLLMLTAIEGNTAIGELLVSRGANVNKTNDFEETALSLAAHGGHIPFIHLLLTNGASKDCRPHGSTLEGWLSVASGLSPDKLQVVLAVISGERVA